MAKLTIGRMANLYGLHRSTLHEAVAKGRVTAGLDGKGQKVIDLSEMIRVYGEPQSSPLHRPTLRPPPRSTLPLHLKWTPYTPLSRRCVYCGKKYGSYANLFG